jgi:hypothetical protein
MPGDPLDLLADFLAGLGITQREITLSCSVMSDMCGAAVLIGSSIVSGGHFIAGAGSAGPGVRRIRE